MDSIKINRTNVFNESVSRGTIRDTQRTYRRIKQNFERKFQTKLPEEKQENINLEVDYNNNSIEPASNDNSDLKNLQEIFDLPIEKITSTENRGFSVSQPNTQILSSKNEIKTSQNKSLPFKKLDQKTQTQDLSNMTASDLFSSTTKNEKNSSSSSHTRNVMFSGGLAWTKLKNSSTKIKCQNSINIVERDSSASNNKNNNNNNNYNNFQKILTPKPFSKSFFKSIHFNHQEKLPKSTHESLTSLPRSSPNNTNIEVTIHSTPKNQNTRTPSTSNSNSSVSDTETTTNNYSTNDNDELERRSIHKSRDNFELESFSTSFDFNANTASCQNLNNSSNYGVPEESKNLIFNEAMIKIEKDKRINKWLDAI